MARTTIQHNRRIGHLEAQIDALRREQERSRYALDVLYTISLACRSGAAFHAIFAAIHQELRALFPVDVCYLAASEPDQPDRFRAMLSVDADREEYVEHVEATGLISLLINQRAPLLFRDVLEEYQSLDGDLSTSGHPQPPARAWLGVPLMIGQDAVGIIVIESYQAGVYNESDRDLLQRMGNIVAVALENARLSQHQRELSSALAVRVTDRSQELATLSALAAELVLQHPLPTLLDRALGLLIPLLHLQGGAVRLLDPPGTSPLDPNQHELVLIAQQGFPPEFAQQAVRAPLQGTPLGEVVIENRPLVLTSGLRDYPIYGVQPPFESLLGLPLRIGERILGTLSLVSTEQQTFDQEQIDLAQAISNLLAMAIENARLFEERERQIAELRAINRISRTVGTALDLPTLLRQVYAALQSFVQLDAFSMVVYDAERMIITDGIAIKEGEEYTYFSHQPPPPDSLTDWVIQQRRTLHFHNLAEELSDYPDLKPYIVGADKLAAAWLGVPLLDRDEQVIGVISIQGYTPYRFSQHDEQFLASVARQVALHLQNVRLLTQRERQIRALDAIGHIGKLVSASFDLDEMLQGIYATLQQVTGAPVFYLAICEPETHIVTHSVFIEQGEQTDLAWQGKAPAPGSLTEWILRERQPLLFHDLSLQRDELVTMGILPRPFGNDWVVRSWVGVPLLAKGGEPIGLLSLQDYQSYLYDEQTVEFLSQVASHVSLGVQKVRLFEDRERQIQANAHLFSAAQAHAAAAERRAHEIELVYRISSVLSSRLDQQEILDLASQELVQLFWADHTGTVLFDEGMPWGTVVAEYPPRDALGVQVPLANNLLHNELLSSRRPVCITSTESDPRAEASRATFRQLGIASLMVVPLVSRGRMIGSISIDSFAPRTFSEEEQDLFLTVAAAIASAVENARLFAEMQSHAEAAERQAKRMELVNRISLVLSSRLDLQEILDLAAREVVQLFWTDHTGIMLLDDDGQTGTVVAEYPSSGALGMRIPVTGNPISEVAIATRRPVCVASIDTDPRTVDIRANLKRLGLASMMVVPLISRGRVIGSIGLDSAEQPRVFTEAEQELFLTVAASIAAAVDNARLFAAEQKARRTADTLREVARVLSSSFNPAEVLQLILRELHNVIVYDTATIMLIEGSMLRIAACRGWDTGSEPRGVTFPIDGSAAGKVARLRRTLVTAEISEDPAWTNRDIGAHIHSWLGVPLIVKGEVLGVLNIDSRQPNHFTERDAEVAQTFANQAAVALENARLYQESVTRVEQELAIARRIQSNLFPRSLPRMAGLTLDATCVPARETGGDFYDFVQLSDRRLAIMVGDVSGKSIPAAMLMAVARSITRSEAHDHEIPQTVMCETNRWIVRDVPRRTFVALCYATLDLEQRQLAFANAGQIAPLRRRADGTVEYLEAPDPRLPLGVLPNVRYAARELTLDPGDLVVFCTDGVVEAHNSDQELFGFERMEALVREYGDLPPRQFIDRVMQAIRAFAGDAPQHDDITLVVARIE